MCHANITCRIDCANYWQTAMEITRFCDANDISIGSDHLQSHKRVQDGQIKS